MTESSMRGLIQVAEGASGLTHDAVKAAADLFVRRVAAELNVKEAFLFGSHARHDAQADSDVDVAIVLNGSHRRLTETVLHLSNIAYDILQEPGFWWMPILYGMENGR